MNRNEGEAMSDLISRRELIENFRKCYRGHLGMENSDSCMTFHGICNVINNTNTSYDIDRVVEEMKKAKHTICLSDDDLEHYQNGIDEAIEIVKLGCVRNNRKDCEYRHDNGNCLKVGGFCTSVDDKHCEKMNHGCASDDVCEWEKGSSGYVGYPAFYSKCCTTNGKGLEMQTNIIADWKYCPYCGKKIKVVE